MSFFTQITSKAGVGIGSGALSCVWTYVSMCLGFLMFSGFFNFPVK
jgi:hypothetical protein